MSQDRITFRTDKELKKEAGRIAKELGTDTSSILNIFLHAFVRRGGIPFEVALDETKEERQALNKILDERQEIIDNEHEGDFVDHNEVKKMVGL